MPHKVFFNDYNGQMYNQARPFVLKTKPFWLKNLELQLKKLMCYANTTLEHKKFAG